MRIGPFSARLSGTGPQRLVFGVQCTWRRARLLESQSKETLTFLLPTRVHFTCKTHLHHTVLQGYMCNLRTSTSQALKSHRKSQCWLALDAEYGNTRPCLIGLPSHTSSSARRVNSHADPSMSNSSILSERLTTLPDPVGYRRFLVTTLLTFSRIIQSVTGGA